METTMIVFDPHVGTAIWCLLGAAVVCVWLAIHMLADLGTWR